MNWKRRAETILVAFSVIGMCLSTPGLVMGGTEPPSPPITDIALHDGGALVGQVVDAQNIAKVNVRVSLQDIKGQELASAVTDQQGHFTIPGLKGGVYQVVTSQGRGIYRLWAPGTAPPSAQQGALIVTGGDIIRGFEPGAFGSFITHPLVLGAIVATAIAVPVALHNSHPASD